MLENTELTTIGETSLLRRLPSNIESQVLSLIKTTKLGETQGEAVLAKFTDGFEPFLRLCDEALAIVVTDESQTEMIKRARSIDMELLDATKKLETIHSTEKEYWLRGGQMVDGCKRIPTNAITEVRSHLKKQFDYVRNIEISRLDAQELERTARLAVYGGLPGGISVRTMSDEQFEITLDGAKVAFEKRADEERSERERLAILQEENSRLTRERDEAERKATAERLERERVDAERLRLEREKQAEIDRVEREKAEEQRQIAAKAELERVAPDFDKLRFVANQIKAIESTMPTLDHKFDAVVSKVRQNLNAAINAIYDETRVECDTAPF